MSATWNQVKLVRPGRLGNDTTSIEISVSRTCFIESEYAHKGWLVSLEDADPSEVWKVSEVYGLPVTSEKLKDHQRAQRVFTKKAEYKNQ